MCALCGPRKSPTVSVNNRSTISCFTSSILFLTIVLLTLCSPAVASLDNTCSLNHRSPFSRSNSHSFVLGKRAPRDEINEITIDTRAAPQHVRSERQQNDDEKNKPGDSSSNSKSSPQEKNREPASAGDSSSANAQQDSNPEKEENSNSSKDDTSPSTTTTAKSNDQSGTTTSTARGLTITASGTISAQTEIQTSNSIGSNGGLPTVFDTNLGSNFTNPNCPKFFREFLKNSTFVNCHPISLLIQNSESFFRISTSAPSLSRVLDASCSASQPTCTSLMTELASQLTEESNCGEDYENLQPIVRRAYAGLITYEPMYQATCLKNPDTHSYCFVDASTNASNVEDSYIYSLALGFPFPGGVRPSCNRCLQATMEIWADTARVEGQPLVDTYIPAAQLVNMGCGPDFVNTTVKVGTLPAVDAAPNLLRSSSSLMGYVSLLSAGVLFLLLS